MTQISDLLDEEFENDDDHKNDRQPIDIIMMPPDEFTGGESKGDSDDSDSPLANLDTLSKKMQISFGEVVNGKGGAFEGVEEK